MTAYSTKRVKKSEGKSDVSGRPAQPPITCPECNSTQTWKDGFRYVNNRPIQRYLCRVCGYRFSEPQIEVNVFREFSETPHSRKDVGNSVVRSFDLSSKKQLDSGSLYLSEDVTSHGNSPAFTSVAKHLKGLSYYSSKCRGHVSDKEMKNLVKVETQTETALRESTQDTKGQIISFAWYLKKQGKKQSTIKTYTDYMKILAKKGNINDIESTKLTIAEGFSDRNTKRLVCCVYDNFLKFQGKTWEKPHYKREHKNPFIPTDEELWTAVNTGNKSNFAFSLLLYETGARYNEAQRLEWTDLDPERNKVTIKASKNGKSRTLSVSKRLISILLNLPRSDNQVTVFKRKANGTRQATFHKRMKMLVRTQNNPRFLKIHYHTFRHCKALREYHKSKSILHVKKILGHRNIMNTQRYLELYTEIYGDLKPENYICEIAQDTKEAKKLIEQGFEYVTGTYNDGGKLFRKVS